jgi:hypothetical protein
MQLLVVRPLESGAWIFFFYPHGISGEVSNHRFLRAKDDYVSGKEGLDIAHCPHVALASRWHARESKLVGYRYLATFFFFFRYLGEPARLSTPLAHVLDDGGTSARGEFIFKPPDVCGGFTGRMPMSDLSTGRRPMTARQGVLVVVPGTWRCSACNFLRIAEPCLVLDPKYSATCGQ